MIISHIEWVKLEELGVRMKMLVKDVMSSPVITVNEDSTVEEAAKLMAEYNIGCVIVTKDNGKPVGIITENDLVRRVVSKNLRPSEVKSKEVMSSPLITIDPEKTVMEAARLMSKRNVRRLAVMYRGRLEGIVAGKDILAITPELIEIIEEKARIENDNLSEEMGESVPMAGYCDYCGQWSENLKEVEGKFLCDECRIELREEV
ncbi:CBS domain-containing protein [Candidatus Bathyarchaeota archaeon]|nr:CBS domain-containing protein [Candidatus Bathyarchaeota archaeon]